MATLNKVMLIGRLTNNPDPPRTFDSGTSVVKFRFAVGRGKKVGDTWEKDPNQLFIDCEAFSRPDSKRNLVELITRWAKKGEPMYLEGRLVLEQWKDKDTGKDRSKHKLIVDSIEFLGTRNFQGDDDGGGGTAGGSRPMSGGRNGGNMSPPDDMGDDHGGGPSGPGEDPIPF
jgi:single-strand DNA-binding protein